MADLSGDLVCDFAGSLFAQIKMEGNDMRNAMLTFLIERGIFMDRGTTTGIGLAGVLKTTSETATFPQQGTFQRSVPSFPSPQKIDLECGPTMLRAVFAGLLFRPKIARQQAAKVSPPCRVFARDRSFLRNPYRW
jgi:hypothetical protein